MKRKSLIFLITLALIGCGTSNNGEIKVEDPYLWLEEVEGKKALTFGPAQFLRYQEKCDGRDSPTTPPMRVD